MLKKLFIIAAIAVLFFGVRAGQASASLELVTNGGFETGDLTGWTTAGIANGFAFANGPGAGHSGAYEAILANTGSLASISQVISTTAGKTYGVSFWLANDMAGTNDFQVLWNGSSVAALEQTNAGAFDYTRFAYTGVASGANTTISFGFQNDQSSFHLDDVHASVPEPACILLLGPGIGCLAGLRYRMKNPA